MSKKSNKILTIILLILSTNIWACSCRDIDDYYTFFRFNTTSFVGKVISVTNKGSYNSYEFQVINKLRTKFNQTIIVTNKNDAVGCTITFQLEQTYILDPYKLKDGYNITACNYSKSSLDKNFNQDTFLIRQLDNKNNFINSRYFKGQLKNGKREGHWTYYNNDDSTSISSNGIYINNKKDGKWTDSFSNKYFQNGKFLKMIEFLGDSVKIIVETLPNSKTMYYSDGKVFKKLTKKNYSVFSTKGNLIETAKIKKNGFLAEWTLFNNDGTVKKKMKMNDDENSISSYEEFYYTKDSKLQ